jgi:hypothetical protein
VGKFCLSSFMVCLWDITDRFGYFRSHSEPAI